MERTASLSLNVASADWSVLYAPWRHHKSSRKTLDSTLISKQRKLLRLSAKSYIPVSRVLGTYCRYLVSIPSPLERMQSMAFQGPKHLRSRAEYLCSGHSRVGSTLSPGMTSKMKQRQFREVYMHEMAVSHDRLELRHLFLQ
jgi:hypothetical protein